VVLINKLLLFLQTVFLSLLFTNIALANLQENIINKFVTTKTLSFNFKQKIADKEEIGNCFIKYPLLMKCNYKNFKQKSVISNGKTVAVVKKKYKKIYYYPIKYTPLFTILNKEKILNLIKNNKPSLIGSSLIEYKLSNKKNKLKLFFDKNTFEFKGWETVDAYSNEVSFLINNLKINNQIIDDFFKIPKEEDL
tara:strand:+ start:178 stop:759 length:582 start_codon:yes stop_codon:yes gene_type:complete